MKPFYLALLAAILAGCCNTTTLGKRPSTAAIAGSNAATRTSLGETRNLIKKSQTAAAKGANSLDSADKTLSALLGK